MAVKGLNVRFSEHTVLFVEVECRSGEGIKGES